MPNRNLNERVASLESGLNSLKDFVNEFATESKQEMREIRDGINEIKKSMSEKNKTNWGQIFSGISIVAMILGWYVLSVVRPVEKDLQNVKEEMREVRAEFFKKFDAK